VNGAEHARSAPSSTTATGTANKTKAPTIEPLFKAPASRHDRRRAVVKEQEDLDDDELDLDDDDDDDGDGDGDADDDDDDDEDEDRTKKRKADAGKHGKKSSTKATSAAVQAVSNCHVIIFCAKAEKKSLYFLLLCVSATSERADARRHVCGDAFDEAPSCRHDDALRAGRVQRRRRHAALAARPALDGRRRQHQRRCAAPLSRRLGEAARGGADGR
jgi:hypothetical protein